MSDELRNLCSSYNVNLKEFGNGHFRLSKPGASLDYWPNAKTKTVFMDGKRINHVKPFEAVQLLRGKDTVIKKAKKKLPKAPPPRIEPKRNAGCLKHFDDREVPWEGEYWIAESDKLRMEAWHLQNKVEALRAEAYWMDKK